MDTIIEMSSHSNQGHDTHQYAPIHGEEDNDRDEEEGLFNQIESRKAETQRKHRERRKHESSLFNNLENFLGLGSSGSSAGSARLPMDSEMNISYSQRPVGVPSEEKLDDFFKDFYEHFYHKGFNAILATEVCNLCTLLFTVFFSTFLLLCVDYIGLMECNAQDCKELPEYFSVHTVKRLWLWNPPNLFSAIVGGYFVLFMAYWIYTFLGLFARVKKAYRMKQMYNDTLGISTRDIQTIRWDNVVNRFIAVQKKNGIHQDTLTAHHIASRILRKENYMIAMINKNILDLSLPLPCIQERVMLTKGLEFNLDVCVFWGMFSRKDCIRKEFLENPSSLRFRFVVAGVLNLVLLPFILLFMIAHFFLKHVQEWRVMQSYLGPRQWTPYAIWQFREFNELPHVFERRMALSYTPASDYQHQFPAPVTAVIARAVSFVSGSFIGALLIITLVDGDEGALLHVKFWDKNLLWYLTIMTAIYAASRSMVQSPSTQDEVYDPEEAMYRLAAHTHYFPLEWRRRCHTYDSLDEFLELFQFKAVIFLREILSTIFTPLILCFSLPSSADAIVDFVSEYTSYEEGLGDVCSYSRFNLSLYGNDKYTGFRAKNSSSRFQPTSQGKMEKSLLSFQEQHPRWFPAEGDSRHGEIFQEKIQEFALSQSQMQLGLEPNINNSQQRPGVGLRSSALGRSGLGRSTMGRSVRFEEATDTITIDSYADNNNNNHNMDRVVEGAINGDSNRQGTHSGGSHSMEMSGTDAFGSTNMSSTHANPFLQGSAWAGRMGENSRMGSMLQSNMAGSNMAGSQFYWLEKYLQTQIREDTIQEED